VAKEPKTISSLPPAASNATPPEAFELIEDIHRLLDVVERARSILSEMRVKDVDVRSLSGLSLVIIELGGDGGERWLGIDPSVLNKFVKMRGKVPLHVARSVTDRIRSFLRSQDQAFQRQPRPTPPPPAPANEAPPAAGITISAERWVTISGRSDLKNKIHAVATLLDNIIEQTKGANEPPEEQILTEIEREQLIAILETALALLQSPMVEKGLLKKAQSVLKKGAENAAEKGVQEGLGKLMGVATERIMELIIRVFS
jgi:hypothetical protein